MSRALANRDPHTKRDDRSGRYSKSLPCDACGKGVGTRYFTDDEVCNGSDDPGFLLCDRPKCLALPGRTSDDVEVRRAFYNKQVASRGGR